MKQINPYLIIEDVLTNDFELKATKPPYKDYGLQIIYFENEYELFELIKEPFKQENVINYSSYEGKFLNYVVQFSLYRVGESIVLFDKLIELYKIAEDMQDPIYEKIRITEALNRVYVELESEYKKEKFSFEGFEKHRLKIIAFMEASISYLFEYYSFSKNYLYSCIKKEIRPLSELNDSFNYVWQRLRYKNKDNEINNYEKFLLSELEEKLNQINKLWNYSTSKKEYNDRLKDYMPKINGFKCYLSNEQIEALYYALSKELYIEADLNSFKTVFKDEALPNNLTLKWIDKSRTRHEPNKQTIFEFFYLLSENKYIDMPNCEATNTNNIYRKFDFIFKGINNFSNSNPYKAQRKTQRQKQLETIIKSL